VTGVQTCALPIYFQHLVGDRLPYGWQALVDLSFTSVPIATCGVAQY
jgi:hypothetical protein